MLQQLHQLQFCEGIYLIKNMTFYINSVNK